jgi:galactoside O-acetyltransferase
MFLSQNKIKKLGIKFGTNVLISDRCSIYGTDIEIGNNVRIDDFCVLSGKIRLGNNIHIGAYCALYGKFGIVMEDYTGLSPRCTIFSASDDFSGNYLISPMNPPEFCNVTGGAVTLKRLSHVCAGSIILPNLTIDYGSVIGALSLLKNSTGNWQLWAGIPAKFIRYKSSKSNDFTKLIENEL